MWAILTTLFCCLPFGIVSIVFAAQVGGEFDGEFDGEYDSGDSAGAVASSKSAKAWAIAAVASFFVVVVGFANWSTRPGFAVVRNLSSGNWLASGLASGLA